MALYLKKILERTSLHVCTLEDIWYISALNLNFLNFAGLTYSLNDSLTGFFLIVQFCFITVVLKGY